MEQIAKSIKGTDGVDSLTLKHSGDSDVTRYYYCTDYYETSPSTKQDSCRPADPIELEKRYLKYVNFNDVRFDIVVMREGSSREYFFYEENPTSKRIVYVQTYGMDRWIGLPRYAISKPLNDLEAYELESLFRAAANSLEQPEHNEANILLEWNEGATPMKKDHSLNKSLSGDVYRWLGKKLLLN